jgi:hypothetical protein
MRAAEAREAARRWVAENAGAIPGFGGAFFHGSINWLPDGAVLPAGSDVDVMVVLAGDTVPPKPGKLLFSDVLLEISYLSIEELRTPESVLGSHHLAGSFRAPGILADPTGHLTTLQERVARDYAKREWIRKRCESARDKILRGGPLRETDALHDQALGWVFPCGILTHILLAAGLRNPTVRRRYVAVRELLEEFGGAAFYPALLEALGCAGMGRTHVAKHLDAMTGAFDAAKDLPSPFPFASDISSAARPIAIDGSREMIERGDHREAVFWIVVTYSRCRKILHHAAHTESWAPYEAGYGLLLSHLGVASGADLSRRREEVNGLVPAVWELAEAIVEANPEAED